MKTINFEHMIGETLDSQLTVSGILRTEANRVIFSAESNLQSAPAREVCLVVDTSEEPAENFKRFLEARYLSHPHLVQPFVVDWLEIDGRRSPCMGMERPEGTLSDAVKQGLFAHADLIELTRQILSAFAYLHSENLVYGALNLDSVWRVEDRWKLSDFSQLRVPGMRPTAETRRFLTNRDIAAPPEVFHGDVGFGWDIWSLGVLVSKIAVPVRKPGMSRSNIQNTEPLPAVLERVLASCSVLDPGGRVSAAEMLEMLNEASSAPETARAQPIPRTELPAPVALKPMLTFPPPTRSIPEPLQTRVTSDRSISTPAHGPSPWVRGLKIGVVAAVVFATSLYVTRRVEDKRAPVSKPAAVAPSSVAAEPSAVSPTVEPVSPTIPKSIAGSKTEISALLGKWADAARNEDVGTQVSCYGPVVDTYFTRHNVTTAELASDKQKSWERNGPLTRFDVLAVKFGEIKPDWAVVSLQKRWVFGGPHPSSGVAREELVVRRIDGEWKITSERGL